MRGSDGKASAGSGQLHGGGDSGREQEEESLQQYQRVLTHCVPGQSLLHMHTASHIHKTLSDGKALTELSVSIE